jgi:hypothetical protein
LKNRARWPGFIKIITNKRYSVTKRHCFRKQ